MITRIIVALDGSALAREAFEYAVAVARDAGIAVEILHVSEPVPVRALRSAGPDDAFMRISEAIRSCEVYARWRQVRTVVEVVEGRLIDRLADLSNAATLIVVGLKGRFARVGAGSTTSWLIHHASGPVLVATGHSQRELRRLLAVYDATEASGRAVTLAVDLGRQTGWPVTALAVPAHHSSLDEVLQAAQELAPEAQVIAISPTGDDEAAQIEAVVSHTTHALLVLGAYADSWIHRIRAGGVTGHVLTHLRAPIVLVR